MENNENFEFCGFPKNEEIEIPDPVFQKEFFKEWVLFTTFRNVSWWTNELLPPEAIEEIEAMAIWQECLLNNFLKSSIKRKQKFQFRWPKWNIKSLGFNIQFHDEECCEECADCEDGDCDNCEYLKNSHNCNGSCREFRTRKRKSTYALCDLKGVFLSQNILARLNVLKTPISIINL